MSTPSNIATDPEIQGALALIEAQLEGERKDRKVPGISAGVVLDQTLVWHHGYGYANLEQKITADEHTVYRVASITKLFTATMLMQLRDAGKLNLDDPIEKYVPEFKPKSTYPDARPLTFRQVVSHGSGLIREGAHEGWIDGEMPPIETLIQLANDSETSFPTATEPKYSNLAIAIMGHALSRIAGQPYDEYIVEHILKPLGMNDSGFDRSRYGDDHRAVGYHIDESDQYFPSYHWNERGFMPGGGMYSTVTDIAKFISLQFSEAPAGGKQVLGWNTLREMHMPVTVTPDFETGFGIGWGIRRLAGTKVIGHSGGLPGYTTNISLAPAHKLGMIVFTNYGTDPVAITHKLLEVLIPVVKRVRARQQTEPSADEIASWQKYVGRYQGRSADDVLDVEIIDKRLTVTFPEQGPAAFVRLEPHSENRFTMRGGHSQNEIATFKTDAEGNVTMLLFGAYPVWRK